MNIRKISRNDYFKNYLDLLSQLTEVNSEKITENLFNQFIDSLNSNHNIFVIENNKKIIATGTILIENKLIHGISKVGHIEDIVVDKNSRGLGLGKKIITFLLDFAEKNNCYKVILNCKEDNCKFYEKCGLTKKEIEMVKYFTQQ